MGTENTEIELERPEGWKGEIVDMRTFDGEIDYFVCDVEGYACIEIDNNYGADADGNRGVSMDFSYVEDISIFLDGDFRPLGRKVKDFFRGTLFGKKWTSFSDNRDFTRVVLGEEVLDDSEKESLSEDLLEKAADYDDRY
jgi:hypothetical protein